MKKVDPYHLWFQIPPNEQPPNHYRLLGLVDFEADSEVIDNAAELRLIFLRTVQNGPNAKLAQELSNEVARARIVLLNPKSKASYDSTIRNAALPIPNADKKSRSHRFHQSESPFTQSPATTAANQLLPQSSVGNHSTENQPAISAIDIGISESKDKKTFLATRRKQNKWLFPALAIGIVLTVCTMGYLVVTFAARDDGSAETSPKNSIKTAELSKTGKTKTAFAPSETHDPNSIGLLSLLEFPHNLRQGSAEWSANKLSLKSQTSINLVDFPIYLPSHFRLEANVTRRSPNDGLGFGMHVAGFPCLLMLDGYPDQGFKTSIRRIEPDPNDKTPRSDIHTGQLLKQDQTHHILLDVTPTSVQLFVDQKPGYRWSGDPSRIRPAPYILPGDSLYQFWLTSWKTKFDIEDLRLVPNPENTTDNWYSECIVPKPLTTIGPSVNLLDKYSSKSIIRKRVSKSNGQIILGPGLRAGVEIPYKLPLEYDIHLTVNKTGKEGFALLPPFHDRRFALMIDQLNNGSLRTGIQTVHRQFISGGVHPGHVRDEILEIRNKIELECRVRRDSIRLFKEGRFILGWTGGRNPIVAPAWKGYSPNTGKHFLRLVSFSNQIHVAKLSFQEVIYRDRPSINNKRLKVIELSPAIKLFQAGQ